MFQSSVYVERRKILRESIKGGLVVLVGNQESSKNYKSNSYRFRQDSTFLYYFGISQANYVGVMDVETGEDFIFADELSINDIVWTGPVPTVKELAESVGVNKTFPVKSLNTLVNNAINSGRRIHFLPLYRMDNAWFLQNLLGINIAKLSDYVSEDLIRAVVAQREIKSELEMTEIDKAVDITTEMQIAAMKMCREGMPERQIAGAIEGISLQYGAGVSFNSIVSINGQVLHNPDYNNILMKGRMMLVDCGAESLEFYAGDQTRTTPVDGEFDSRQKEIYQIVLNTKIHAEQVAGPGMDYRNVHMQAMKDITEGMKSIGLMKGNTDEAVMAGAPALFMPHGLGHQMGLDVHDMEHIGEDFVGYDDTCKRSSQFGLSSLRMGKTLRPGHVITVEPGIYFIPELFNIWRSEKKCMEYINYDKVEKYLDFGGIRLENDILITETGNRQTGHKHTPITIDEVINAVLSK